MTLYFFQSIFSESTILCTIEIVESNIPYKEEIFRNICILGDPTQKNEVTQRNKNHAAFPVLAVKSLSENNEIFSMQKVICVQKNPRRIKRLTNFCQDLILIYHLCRAQSSSEKTLQVFFIKTSRIRQSIWFHIASLCKNIFFQMIIFWGYKV